MAVVYAEATAPVVRAQTPPLLRALREAGRTVDAAVFTSLRARLVPGEARSHARALAAFADATLREPIRRSHLPRDRGLVRLGRKLARDLAARDEGDAVLFCRQPRAALVGIATRDSLRQRAAGGAAPRVVLDLRGIRDVEYLMTLGKAEADLVPDEAARFRAYTEQEGEACRGADAVLCVSRPMVRLVRDRWGIPDERLGRVPNHAEPLPDAEAMRAAARRDLGVDDRTLLVAYSGTLAAWQMPEKSVLLVQAVSRMREGTRMLFLTPDQDAARAALRAAGLDDAILRSARPGEATKLLCAADYGLLLREDSLVNRVACPVKFGEYLACGVRPILTPHIGDQTDACHRDDLGVVVGTAEAAEGAKRVALDAARPGTVDATGRARRRAWALEHLSPAQAAARVLEFLSALPD